MFSSLQRRARLRLEEQAWLSKDQMAVTKLGSLLDGLPLTSSSLRPSTLLAIVNDLSLNQRTNVVEFGSGISTVVLARKIAIDNLNCNVLSIDESDDWSRQVNEWIGVEREPSARSVVAPLRKSRNSESVWYDLSKVQLPRHIDLVVVDGPSTVNQALMRPRRYAAHAVSDHLASSFGILIDDVHRKQESEDVQLWADMLMDRGISVRWRHTYAWVTAGQCWNVDL